MHTFFFQIGGPNIGDAQLGATLSWLYKIGGYINVLNNKINVHFGFFLSLMEQHGHNYFYLLVFIYLFYLFVTSLSFLIVPSISSIHSQKQIEVESDE